MISNCIYPFHPSHITTELSGQSVLDFLKNLNGSRSTPAAHFVSAMKAKKKRIPEPSGGGAKIGHVTGNRPV